MDISHNSVLSASLGEEPQVPLGLLADAMPQLVWSTGPDGLHDYHNQQWYDYTGTTSAQARGEGWAHLLHPDDRQQAVDRWTLALRTGEPYEIEFRLRRASDGAFRWFLGRALPIKDEQGHIARWFGTCTDIHDQKQAQLDMARVSERERHIAEALQGTVQPILPDGIPGLDLASFYRAALNEANVGGDFSDVFPIEKGCHALVVGDLSGKGLAAAVQVSMVRNMLRHSIYTWPSIAEAITRLNTILITHNLLEGFATLVVVAFDLGMKTLTYVSCGQEPALLRRTADGDVQELPPTGPILGATEAAKYQEQVIPIRPGDAFALYTDGLTEAGPSRSKLLGVAGVASLLRDGAGNARSVVTRIVEGAGAYAQGVFHDDVCLLVGVVEGNGHGP